MKVIRNYLILAVFLFSLFPLKGSADTSGPPQPKIRADSSSEFSYELSQTTSFPTQSLSALNQLHSSPLPAIAKTLETPPTTAWIRQFGTTGTDEALSVSVDISGNIYVAGGIQGAMAGAHLGGWDAFLRKYNPSGSVAWTRQLGTASGDEIYSVFVDISGDIYVSGRTEGALEGASLGGMDAFLTKYDSTGSISWTRQFGTPNNDVATSVSVDGSGNIYMAGLTYGALGGSSFGGIDPFLRKYSPTGSVVWTRQFGTSGDDIANSISIDSSGNIYVAGYVRGALEGANLGGADAFLRKYDPTGSVAWTRQFGTSGDDVANSISIDSSGNIYVAAHTWGIITGANLGAADAFLRKYDPTGSIVWTRQFGTTGYDEALSVSVDSSGNLYVAGHVGGYLEGGSLGGSDAFLRKYDPTGSVAWTSQFGSSSNDLAWRVTVDSSSNIYVAGSTDGVLSGQSNSGGKDAFLIKFIQSLAITLSAPTGLSKISPDNNPLPAFKWASVASATSYEVKMDASVTWTNIGNKLTYVQPTVLSQGSHTFYVRAKDGAGNAGTTASISFNVSVVANLANTRIAFTSNRTGNHKTYIMNSDGTGQSQLASNQADERRPVWSPHGTKIAFSSNRDGNDEIYVMNSDGTNTTRLTNSSGDDFLPAWSPDGSKIAFASRRDGNLEIYVMNSDGTGQIRLTINSASDDLPSWSPDGSRIAFVSSRDGNYEIYVINSDGTNPTRLTTNSALDLHPAWSPDGSRIAFVSDFDIYVMNSDGSGQIRLTTNPAEDRSPFWSPDGSKIAFYSYRDGNAEVYIMNADGSGQVRLTNNTAEDWLPAWSPFLALASLGTPTGLSKISPDNNPLPAFKWASVANAASYEVKMDATTTWTNIGNKLTYVQPTVLSQGSHTFYVRAKDGAGNSGAEASLSFNVSVAANLANTKIAFNSNRSGTYNIHLMNADGTNQTNITNNSPHDQYPVWSPDGTKIAFRSNKDGYYKIYVMNADGSGQIALTNNTYYNDYPKWSPDGSKIAFNLGTGATGILQIHTINADGSGLTQLTNNAEDYAPSWSPDGTKIAFVSKRDGNPEIYVMNADGSGQTRLTNNAAWDEIPVWSPNGTKIAFGSERDGNREIYIMNSDGSGQTRLTNNPHADYDPSWSPDGSKIAFEAGYFPNYDIYVMNADGTGQTKLTTNGATDYVPSWSPFLSGLATPGNLIKISPDNNPLPAFKWTSVANAASYEVKMDATATWTNIGNKLTYVQPTVLSQGAHTFYVRAKDGAGNTGAEASLNFNVSVTANLANTKIAFHSYTNPGDNNLEVYVMNADGSGRTKLTNNSAKDYSPDWSPAGDKIVFNSMRDGNEEIYVMNAEGSGQTRLTNDGAIDRDADWSPDGAKIAFVRAGEIYVMNANGSGQIKLTNDSSAFDPGPTWSPDGTKIAFTSNRDANYEIYVMNIDGSGQTRLTNNLAKERDPDWSPDGTKIAFGSIRDGNYEIYVMNADGSSQTRLTNNNAIDLGPSWSPDGSKIVFTSNRSGGFKTYVMNADGSGQTILTNSTDLDEYPVWSPFLGGLATPTGLSKISPDNNPLPAFKWASVANSASYEVKMDASVTWTNIGNKLTYVQPAVLSQGSHTFYVRAKDGAGNAGTAATIAFNVSVTADLANTKIAFMSQRDGNREIYVMKPDGSGQLRLTNNAAADDFPSISPDGTKIAFVSTRHGNEEIYVMNIDGSNLTRLTNNAAADTFPNWSPDGGKIVFDSNRDGNREIYIMDSVDANSDNNGDNLTRLTNNPAIDTVPAWSPDGSKIVFSTRRHDTGAGNSEIYVMDAKDINGDGNGDNAVRLTTHTAGDSFPKWSPDGKMIAFQSFRQGNYNIFIMAPTDADNDGTGDNLVAVTSSSLNDEYPSWSPDGSRIIFESSLNSAGTIYVVNANGSNLTQITTTDAGDEFPAWSPFLAAASGDTTAPATPTLTAPADGSTSTTTTPTFTWSAVTDASSPVLYDLQVSTSSSISSTYISKTNVAANTYSLSSAEALQAGTWYWRVRARDSATPAWNYSAWSSPTWSFTIASPTWSISFSASTLLYSGAGDQTYRAVATAAVKSGSLAGVDPGDIAIPPNPPPPNLNMYFTIPGSGDQYSLDARPPAASITWSPLVVDLVSNSILDNSRPVTLSWTLANIPAEYNLLLINDGDSGATPATVTIDMRSVSSYSYTGSKNADKYFTVLAAQNRPPSVQVIYPSGAEVGGDVQVRAQVSDPDFADYVSAVAFYYATSSFTTWIALGTGSLISGTTASGIWAASWNTASLPEGSGYKVRAAAFDSKGASATGDSPSSFSITQRWMISLQGTTRLFTGTANDAFTSFATAAVTRNSSSGADSNDIARPPNPPPPALDVYFVIGGSGEGYYQDSRPLASSIGWSPLVVDLVSNSTLDNSRPATLGWTIRDFPSTYRIFLTDDGDFGLTPATAAINMRTSSSYSYTGSRNFDRYFSILALQNRPPVVSVAYPNSGQVGGNIQVRAQISEPDGISPFGDYVASVAFYYATSPWNNWISMGQASLISGTTASGTWAISWNTTVVPEGGNYKIRATASDSVGASSQDESDSAFSVARRIIAASTFVNGWNMFSIPLTPDPADFASQMGDDVTPPYYVFHYDNNTRMYVQVTQAEAGPGYWVKVNGDSPYEVEGVPLPAGDFEMPVGLGWNQIGHPFTSAVNWGAVRVKRGAEIKTMAAAATAGWMTQWLYWYNPVTRSYVVGDPASGSLSPHTGYWVKANTDGVSLIIPPP